MRQQLERSFRHERGTLLGYIRSKVASLEDAEDILQDVYYQAARNLNATQPVENLMGWLFTIARNRIVDLYRKKKCKTVSFDKHDDEASLLDLIKDSGIDLEKDFIRTQVMEAIIESLDELPENQRQAFLLQAVEGLTFSEIAAATGISINTLIARKRYAVLFLRKRLADIKDVLAEIE